MIRIQPELLATFLEEAQGYLERVRLFVADPVGEKTGPEAILADLENLKGVCGLVGLDAPRRMAERLLELLTDPLSHRGEPFSVAATPFVNALGDMLGALKQGRVERLDEIYDKVEAQSVPLRFPSGMPPELSAELMEIFLAEGEESGRGMEKALRALQKQPDNMVERSHVVRHFLKLKSAAAMVNQYELIQILDMMGEVFDALEKGLHPVDVAVAEFFIHGIQAMNRILADLKGGRAPRADTLENFRSLALTRFPELIEPPAEPPAPLVFSRPDEPAAFDDAELARELRQTFLLEAQEHLTEMRQLILAAQSETPEADLVHRLFRVVHTLKGASATAGMPHISKAAHELENVLDAWRMVERAPEEELIVLLYESEGLLRRMLADAEQERPPAEAHPTRLIALARQFLASAYTRPEAASAPGESLPGDPEEEGRDPDSHRRTVRVAIDRLDSLINLASELSAYRSRLDDTASEFAGMGKRLKWERRNLNRVMNDFQRKHQWDVVRSGPATTDSAEFSDLELDRYDDVGVFTRTIEDLNFKIAGMLDQVQQQLARFREDSQVMGRLLGAVKDEIIQARMVPLHGLFHRIDFQTRQLARSLNKKVRVVARGGATEIDKSLSDALAEPLSHLVRNCLDHGFEPPEERLAGGKPEEGRLTLTAFQNERNVVIQIEDDGRGIDTQRLCAVALREGLFQAGELEARSHEDLLALVYHPRISTSDSPGEVSGRGVGMDVVRHRIGAMYGAIRLESEPQQGTRFTITLPSTLAVQPILSVSADPHTFNLPMHYVTRILEASELEESVNAARDAVSLGDESLPLRWLARFMGLDHDPEISGHPGVVLRAGDRRMVLVVDAVTGREEAIVRPLSPLVDGVTHVLGTTITPQGQVRLVLNIPFLFELNDDPQARSLVRFPAQERVRVLIADDSLSVRQTIKHQLTRRGIKANTAKDGLAAWQKLHTIRPDLMIVDLEMPGLNGYELMEHVRQSADFANLPMLVLTSRGGAKHHQKAMTCGADGFLTKPALERELMSRIRSVLPPHLRDLLDARDPLLKT